MSNSTLHELSRNAQIAIQSLIQGNTYFDVKFNQVVVTSTDSELTEKVMILLKELAESYGQDVPPGVSFRDVEADDTIVDMYSAFAWVCPQCQQIRYVLPNETEFSEEEREEKLRVALGLNEWEPIPDDVGLTLVQSPDKVTCDVCMNRFETFDVDTNDGLSL